DLTVGVDQSKPKASAAFVVGAHQVYVPLAGMVDLEAERDRMQKEIDQKEKFLMGIQRKLQNEAFTSRAPEAVVAKEHQKAVDTGLEVQKLRATLAELG
ncbi:MAG: valyl-tRNA synthetase, partial [Rhodothermales bacterium]